MMNRKFAIVSLSIMISASALAGVKVTSLNYAKEGNEEKIKIQLSGRTTDLPDVVVKNKTIEIYMSNSEAFEAIKKDFDGRVITATKKDGKAYIKASLPSNVIENSMNVDFKDNQISLAFKSEAVALPKRAPKDVKTNDAPKKTTQASNVKKENLNEDYLTRLAEEDTKPTPVVAPVAQEDTIKTTQAAPSIATTPEVKKSNDFSMVGYAVKFSVFLAAVLGLFYGVVQLMKKGLFNKGKLGFLNNSTMIEVLSTTYVAPKRSLMIVKAHKQVFLVSNSENGLTFLSEMTDTAGLFKEGEKILTGANFDTNLDTAESSNFEIKLKENIHESTPVATKDVAKFSEELKKKAKKLKPIEFN